MSNKNIAYNTGITEEFFKNFSSKYFNEEYENKKSLLQFKSIKELNIGSIQGILIDDHKDKIVKRNRI